MEGAQRLRTVVATVPASTYVPLAVGAVIAGVGALAYLLRYDPPASDKDFTDKYPDWRQLALRIVSSLYLGLACLFLCVALVVGGGGFILTGALLVALALGVLFSVWGRKVGDRV